MLTPDITPKKETVTERARKECERELIRMAKGRVGYAGDGEGKDGIFGNLGIGNGDTDEEL